MARSVEAGRIVELPSFSTLSDGTAGGIEPDSITFGLCRELVDDFVVVNEEEIAEAMRMFIDRQHQLLEGAAGVAIAGLMQKRNMIRGRKTVVVICGGNISRETLREILGERRWARWSQRYWHQRRPRRRRSSTSTSCPWTRSG